MVKTTSQKSDDRAQALATLLLTAPLGDSLAPIFSPEEFHRLCATLREVGLGPEAFLGGVMPAVFVGAGGTAEGAFERQIRALIARELLVERWVREWRGEGIEWVAYGTQHYPKTIAQRLGAAAPPILWWFGMRPEFYPAASRTLGIVGARDAEESVLRYAYEAGKAAAEKKLAVCSGGASGVDMAAMLGSLEAGGKVVAFLATSMREGLRQRALHPYFPKDTFDYSQCRLSMVTCQEPQLRFSGAVAMQRNALIYSFGAATLAVHATQANKGGTWGGALNHLQRRQHQPSLQPPVFVRSELCEGEEQLPEGNLGLQKEGAIPFALANFASQGVSYLTRKSKKAATPLLFPEKEGKLKA